MSNTPVRKILAVYFSPTGTTKKAVTKIANVISKELGLEYDELSFTSHLNRKENLKFTKDTVVVFGTPVYAGRVPNVLIKFLEETKSDGSFAIPVVLFGNRAFEDALIELRDILINGGLKPFAAGAFVGEHSFSNKIATGRPDQNDIAFIEQFAKDAALKLKEIINCNDIITIDVEGTPYPYNSYYQPKNKEGAPISVIKAKPLTSDLCDNCKVCVELCPMGSIDPDDPKIVNGICIKCSACIKLCPKNAKYFTQDNFVFHMDDLIEKLSNNHAEAKVFL